MLSKCFGVSDIGDDVIGFKMKELLLIIGVYSISTLIRLFR